MRECLSDVFAGSRGQDVIDNRTIASKSVLLECWRSGRTSCGLTERRRTKSPCAILNFRTTRYVVCFRARYKKVNFARQTIALVGVDGNNGFTLIIYTGTGRSQAAHHGHHGGPCVVASGMLHACLSPCLTLFTTENDTRYAFESCHIFMLRPARRATT